MQTVIICCSLFLPRTQLKKFLGKSVKKAKHLAEEYGEKAVNKVKSVRDEGEIINNNCFVLFFLHKLNIYLCTCNYVRYS